VEIGLHSFGRTALHIAAADGRAEIVELLLHAKASVHAKDNAG
jgi:ankyrin repeat protein